MKILITGCLGHIGSYLVKNIHKIKKIKKIYLLDNISNNKFFTLSNIKNTNQNKIFIYDNLINPKHLYKIRKVDVVIHLASTTDAQKSVLNKKKYIQNNLGSFNNIVKYCKKTKAKLIHISSTSVYGKQTEFVDEQSKFLNPQSPYAEIKLKEENILFLNPINASRFVNKNFDELSLWWAKKKTFFESNKKTNSLNFR